MPVTQDKPAPYAPAKAILGIIDRYRNKGMPAPIDADTLMRAGVSDSLVPRTLQALTAFDLIDEGFNPTDTLEGLRLAPEAEFEACLAVWLKEVYADALNFVDPDADETDIRDAFRSYKPVGQQPRMVSLFTGLFTAAGLREKTERKSAAGQPNRNRKTVRRPPPRDPPPRGQSGKLVGNVDPALAGLLQSLPSQGAGWTKEKRDQFMAAFGTVLDFCVPIVSASNAEIADADADADE